MCGQSDRSGNMLGGILNGLQIKIEISVLHGIRTVKKEANNIETIKEYMVNSKAIGNRAAANSLHRVKQLQITSYTLIKPSKMGQKPGEF